MTVLNGSNQHLADDHERLEFLAWKRLYLSKAKLSGITEIATLLAGFSVVSVVELQISPHSDSILLSVFAVGTALLVCTTMLSILISTCILPHIEVVAKLKAISEPDESPHDMLMWYIDLSWVLVNIVSIFLFTLDVIILCWIKLSPLSTIAPLCATIIMIPILLCICAFGIVFYRSLVMNKVVISERKCEELEQMRKNLDANDSKKYSFRVKKYGLRVPSCSHISIV